MGIGHRPQGRGRKTGGLQARYVNPLDPSKKVGRNFGLEYEAEAYRWLDAAALAGRADVIATWNMKHFPETALAPYGLRAVTPDDLLCELFAVDPEDAMTVMHELVASKRRPPRTMREEIEPSRG